MNATKRKFNALLQGMGTRPAQTDGTRKSSTPPADAARPASIPLATPASAAPSSTTSTATTSTTPRPHTSAGAANVAYLAKRRRVADVEATLRDTTGSAVPRPSSSVLRRWGSRASASVPTSGSSSGSASGSTPAPAPRYCPGDREQLLRRLATFQELTDWSPKPDGINEIVWAQRGWVCQGKERVRCTLCSKELVVRLRADEQTPGQEGSARKDAVASPLPTDDATEAAFVARYAELVVSAHQEDCLWQRKGCDASLLRLPLASPQQAGADLKTRYDELCGRKDFLPYEFNLRLPLGLDVDAVLATLPPGFFGDDAGVRPNRAALALAVMGWQGLTNSRIGPVPNSASCHACLRRLGLWMFKSKQVDPATDTVLEPAPMDYLDGVREHRFFCPWKNGGVQRNPGAADVPGWQVLVTVLRNDAYLRNRLQPGPAEPATRPAEPATPRRAMTPGTTTTTPGTATRSIFGRDSEADAEDEAARNAKDKERWARLRRVKSLFDTKGAKKPKRGGTMSTSTTATSLVRPTTAQSVHPSPAN